MKTKEAIEIIEIVGIHNYGEIQKKLHKIDLLHQDQKNLNNHLDNSFHKNNIDEKNKLEDIHQRSYNLRNKKRKSHVLF